MEGEFVEILLNFFSSLRHFSSLKLVLTFAVVFTKIHSYRCKHLFTEVDTISVFVFSTSGCNLDSSYWRR